MFLFLLPNHQFPWEGDDFQAFVPDAAGALDMLQRVTADEVITGAILVHQTKEHFLDAGTLLIDGIIQRIYQMIHTLYHLLLIQHLSRRHIITQQFIPIIRQMLELDTLRMRQEQQIHSLVNGLLRRPLAASILSSSSRGTPMACSKRSVLPSACN